MAVKIKMAAKHQFSIVNFYAIQLKLGIWKESLKKNNVVFFS
jgi:hypothetical protein